MDLTISLVRSPWDAGTRSRGSRDLVDFGKVPLQHLPDAAVVISYRHQEVEMLGEQISHGVDRLVLQGQHPMRREDAQLLHHLRVLVGKQMGADPGE